jgi:hypothetical protein
MSLSVVDIKGTPLYFGTVDKIPEDVKIVVDFRLTAEKEPQLREEHIRHACFDAYETHRPETFKDLINDLMAKLVEGKSLYLLDNCGAGNSAMVAWILTVKVLYIGRETGLDMVKSAYLSQNDLELKWKELGVPRYSRMLYYGEFFLRDWNLRIFWQKFMKRQNALPKSMETGKLMTANLPHELSNGPIWEPLVEGFKNIQITTTSKCQWRNLHPDVIGPYNFPITTVKNETIYAANLTNLIYSVSVYQSAIDEDDKLKSLFFEDRENIARKWPNNEKIRHTIKIRHPRAKEVTLEKPYPTYSKGEPPVCYFWLNHFLLEVEFRKFWSRIYEELAINSTCYKNLKQLQKDGTSLQLMDYNGYNFIEEGLTLEELFDNPELPWSFTHVLYGMLTDQRVWEKSVLNSSDSDIESGDSDASGEKK